MGPQTCQEKNIGLLKRIHDQVAELNPDQKMIFLHCIIHQEMLCKCVLKISHVVDTVTKVVNFIRAKYLNHRQFVSLLEETIGVMQIFPTIHM
jgi:hypothetical protein